MGQRHRQGRTRQARPSDVALTGPAASGNDTGTDPPEHPDQGPRKRKRPSRMGEGKYEEGHYGMAQQVYPLLLWSCSQDLATEYTLQRGERRLLSLPSIDL